MKVALYVNDTFGDFVVGLFKQVTLLHSDHHNLIRQVLLYYKYQSTQAFYNSRVLLRFLA